MDKKDSTIFIGKKPSMQYVLAVVTQLNATKGAVIKARGNAINKAVDVAEIVRKRFIQDAKISEITIDTEEIGADNEKINVSVIEIKMAK